MMNEYFEIEASKSTSQYRFRKGLKIFGDKGYQAAKDKLKKIYWEEVVLTCYHGRTLCGIFENDR